MDATRAAQGPPRSHVYVGINIGPHDGLPLEIAEDVWGRWISGVRVKGWVTSGMLRGQPVLVGTAPRAGAPEAAWRVRGAEGNAEAPATATRAAWRRAGGRFSPRRMIFKSQRPVKERGHCNPWSSGVACGQLGSPTCSPHLEEIMATGKPRERWDTFVGHKGGAEGGSRACVGGRTASRGPRQRGQGQGSVPPAEG